VAWFTLTENSDKFSAEFLSSTKRQRVHKISYTVVEIVEQISHMKSAILGICDELTTTRNALLHFISVQFIPIHLVSRMHRKKSATFSTSAVLC